MINKTFKKLKLMMIFIKNLNINLTLRAEKKLMKIYFIKLQNITKRLD